MLSWISGLTRYPAFRLTGKISILCIPIIFFMLKLEVEFKNYYFVATGTYFIKEPFDDHLKNMEIL
jgi:hypothetical protein